MSLGRVAIVSLGCAKNLVNSEQMMFLLREAGYEVAGETKGAQTVIVNTCGFIESAKLEAIETIIELGQAKKAGLIGNIIVAGCLAQRYKDDILVEMPEIDAIVGVGGFDEIVSAVKNVTGENVTSENVASENVASKNVTGESVAGYRRKTAFFGDKNAPVSETGRIITTSPSWAYLKIAEGCDNRCAYCSIPDIRGAFRSRPLENVVNEARRLTDTGIKELILVAQDVTQYGRDIYGKRSLSKLLKGLCEIEKLKWLRLHYLYPGKIDEELIDEIAKNGKILKYLDIPIQHINDEILKNMNRRGGGCDIRALFRSLRQRIPGLVLRTSIITGLPGEGEKEFEELAQFLREAKIERAGVFPYSPEEGTPAAEMEFPHPDVAAHRAELLFDLQSRIMDEFNKKRIGEECEVLVESFDGKRYYGRSYAESPDVDGYIAVIGDGIPLHGFVDVRITGSEDGMLVGELVVGDCTIPH